jgi:hypothetical protein
VSASSPRLSSASRGAVVFVGAGGIVLAVLSFVQNQLDALHLQSAVKFWASAVIAAVAVLADQLRGYYQDRQDAVAAAAELDAALASWPPRAAAEVSPFDVGVHSPPSGLPHEYAERDADDEIAAALAGGGAIVVTGPPGCGKSRSAFQAIRAAGCGRLLAPTGAGGLQTVLDRGHRLGGGKQHTVLWLDGLDRFVEGLDLDRLERFLHRSPERQVRVAATIRSDRLEELLAGEDERSRAARRLLARAQGVALADTLSRPERDRFAGALGLAALPAVRVSELYAADPGRAGWTPSIAAPGHQRRDVELDVPALLPVLFSLLLLIGCVVALLIAGHRDHWTVPAPVDRQVRDLKAGLLPCQVAGTTPSAELGDGDLLAMLVHNGSCPGPDALRLYQLQGGRLQYRVTEVPADTSTAWGASCLGPFGAGSCILSLDDLPHAVLETGTAAPVGLQDPATLQSLPYIVYAAGGGLLRVSAPFLPAPPRPAIAVERRQVTVPLRPGAPIDPATDAPAGCQLARALCGYPAEGLAALPAGARHPPLLAAAYVLRGNRFVPSELLMRAWALRRAPAGLVVGSRPCLRLQDGQVVSPAVPLSGSRTDVAAALRGFWDVRGEREDVIC